MTHYIVVLRGLTLGQTAAQVAHAAGESFYLFAGVAQLRERRASQDVVEVGGENPSIGPTCSGVAQLSERREARQGSVEVAGGNPASGATADAIDRTTVVVLGARNSIRLERLARTLTADGIPHVIIREPDAPFNGRATAVGLVPGDREKLLAYVRDFHLLPEPTAQVA